MRLAIIGNSHVAALRLGDGDREGWTYFASAAGSLRDLQIESDALAPANERLRRAMRKSSGGMETIRPADHDAFVIYGLVGISEVAPIATTHLPLRFAAEDDTAAPVSDAFFRDAVRSMVHRSLAARILTKLRKLTATTVVLVPSPLPAASVVHDPARGRAFADPDLARVLCEVLDAALGDLDACFVQQPGDTTEGGIFSAGRFSDGSVRLGADGRAHPAGESFHMNAEYGRIMAAEITRALHVETC